MIQPIHVLRERDHKIYVVALDCGDFEPQVIRRWYPTGVRANELEFMVGDYEGMEISYDRTSWQGGVYEIRRNLQISLSQHSKTLSAYTDRIPLQQPKTRRKGNVRYTWGEWQIVGKHGWETLERVNLRDYIKP